MRLALRICLIVLAATACGDGVVQERPPGPSSPTQCATFADYLHTYALVPTPGRPRDAVASGDYAFVADEGAGLTVVDLSDPPAANAIHSISLGANALCVALAGDNLALVGLNGGGVVVVDVTSPPAAGVIETIPTPGGAVGLAVDGATVFVADAVSGLVVIDANARAIIGVENTPGLATGVSLDGAGRDLALVSDATLGLRVINTGDPEAPWLVTTFDTPGEEAGVASRGNLAFVAAQANGLHVVDIECPANPVLLGTVDTPGSAVGVDAGSYVFVADRYSGLQVVDVSDPTSPRIVSTTDSFGETMDVTLDGDRLMMPDRDVGLRAIDVGRVENPPAVPVLGGDVGVVVSAPGRLYAAVDGEGLEVLEPVEDQPPVPRGELPLLPQVLDAYVCGDTLLLALENTNAVAVDVSNPDQPLLAFEFPLSGGTRGIACRDGVAYMARGISAFIEYPLGDNQPSRGATLGSSFAVDVALSQGFAYVASTVGRVWVVNTTTMLPANAFDVGGSAEQVMTTERPGSPLPERRLFVAVASGHPAVRIYDLISPLSPQLLASIPTAGPARALTLDGAGVMYVAEGAGGIEVIDILDPSRPVRIGSITAPPGAARVAHSSGMLFGALRSGGLAAWPTEGCIEVLR